LKAKLKFIATEIDGAGIKSVHNWIIIYTDEAGQVLVPPHIGGSRAELDPNQDDLDCEDGTEETLGASTEAPITEGFKVCDSHMLATDSSEGQECQDCRECVLVHCDTSWADGTFCKTFCKKVLEVTEVPTPDHWMACLESNGVISSLVAGQVDVEHGFNTWCVCVAKCEGRCIVRDLRHDECGAANMQDKNCGTCRECLKGTCGEEWMSNTSYCMELLNGNLRQTNADEWLACLESNGQNKNLNTAVIRNIDDKDYYLCSSLWAPCTRGCDAECHSTEVLDERAGECGAVNMANSDCTMCRECIKEECTVWVEEETNDDYCWRLLNGQVKVFPDNWLACLESNGTHNNLADYEVLAGILVAMIHGRHVPKIVRHSVLRRRHRILVGRNAATRTFLKQNV
jgi:hypothetical protein